MALCNSEFCISDNVRCTQLLHLCLFLSELIGIMSAANIAMISYEAQLTHSNAPKKKSYAKALEVIGVGFKYLLMMSRYKRFFRISPKRSFPAYCVLN